MYTIENTGKSINKKGVQVKVGPRLVQTANGKRTQINPGETKDVNVSDDVARILISLDGGPLKFHLTEAQAKRINRPIPLKAKKESKNGIHRADSS
jgi:hypothetical protein